MSAAKSSNTDQPCKAIRRNGQPCQALALPSGYCFAHDPALAEKRDIGRKHGGKNRGVAIRLQRLCPPRLIDVFDKLETALSDVLAGKLDPKQAGAAAALARAMVAVLTGGEQEASMRQTQEEIAELREIIDRVKRERLG